MSDSTYDPFKIQGPAGDPAPSEPAAPAGTSPPPEGAVENQFPPIAPIFPQSPVASQEPGHPQETIAAQGPTSPTSPLSPPIHPQDSPQGGFVGQGSSPATGGFPTPGAAPTTSFPAPGAFPPAGGFPAQGAFPAQGQNPPGSYAGQNPSYGAPPPKSGNGNKVIGIVVGVGCAGALILGLLVIGILMYIGKNVKNAESTTGSSTTTSSTTAGSSTAGSSTSDSSASTTPASSSSSDSGSTSSSSGTSASWTQYTSEEYNYMTRFPGKPSPASTQDIKTGTGTTPMKTIGYSSPSGNDAYYVDCMKLGSDPDKSTLSTLLDATSGGVAKQGELVSNKSLTFNGLPAREVLIVKDISGQTSTMDDLIFVNNGILYQLMTIFPKAEDHAADTQRFHEAFQLTTS